MQFLHLFTMEVGIRDEAKLKKRVVTAILKALPMSPLPLPDTPPSGVRTINKGCDEHSKSDGR